MNKTIKLNEEEFKTIYNKYTPSMIGIVNDYTLFPIQPNKCLFLKVKNKKYIDGFLQILSYNKTLWEKSLNLDIKP